MSNPFEPKHAGPPKPKIKRVIGNYEPNKSSRIAARICRDVSVKEDGKEGKRYFSGPRRYWAYGYKHLSFLLMRTRGSLRVMASEHRITFDSLACVIVYAADNPKILAHCRAVAEWQLRDKIAMDALKPHATKIVKNDGDVSYSLNDYKKRQGRPLKEKVAT
jgi:hypothetical protein